MADGSSKNINAVAFRGCFLEVLRREELCKVINQLVNAISSLALNTVVGFTTSLQLVKRSLGVERFAVEDVDSGEVKGL